MTVNLPLLITICLAGGAAFTLLIGICVAIAHPAPHVRRPLRRRAA